MSPRTLTITRRTAAIGVATAVTLGAVIGGFTVMATTDAGIRATAGSVFTPPSSIDSTGTTDVSDALSQWIENSTSDGSATTPSIIRLDGTYRVEYGLSIGSATNSNRSHPGLHAYQRHHVVLDLTHATLVQYDATAYDNSVSPTVEPRKRWGVPIIKVVGGSDIRILGGTLLSSNVAGTYSKARESWAGVTINGTDSIALVGMSISGVWGDFVYVNHWPAAQRAHDVLIDGGSFSRNGRQGITFNAVDGLEIRYVAFHNVQRMLFDHEPDRLGGATAISIHDNTGDTGGLGFLNLRPLAVTPLHDIAIADNHLARGHFRTTASSGTGGTLRTNLRFTGNTTDEETPYLGGYLGRTPLIAVQGTWDSVTVTGNHDVGGAKARAVAVSPGATHVTVGPNNFVGFASG